MRALLVALALLLALPASADVRGSSKPGAKARIACLGDSITYGAAYATTPFPERVEALYGATHVDVVNLGVGGYTAAQIAAAYTASVDGQRFAVVVIQGGINDIAVGGDGTATFNTLNAIATDALADGKRVAWVNILPFHDSGSWSASIQTEIEEFNALVAARAGIVAVDAYTALQNPASQQYLLPAYHASAAHPNDAGCAVLAAAVKAGLNP